MTVFFEIIPPQYIHYIINQFSPFNRIKRIMKNYVILVVSTLLILGNAQSAIAQQADSTAIFGYEVPRSAPDTAQKKCFLKKLIPHPAFIRLGVAGGGIMSLNSDSEIGGSTGMRAEYGFSNKFSLIAAAQMNDEQNNTAISTMQTSLVVHWMPFKANRLQPFFGAGWGLGLDGFGHFGRGGRGDFFDNENNQNSEDVQNFAVAQTGLNYVIFRRLIATAEVAYQLPIGGTTSINSNGLLAANLAVSYQFGKRK